VLAGLQRSRGQGRIGQAGTQGIRTAKVVQEREAGTAHQLKLPAVSESLKAKLLELKASLAGHAFKACS